MGLVWTTTLVCSNKSFKACNQQERFQTHGSDQSCSFVRRSYRVPFAHFKYWSLYPYDIDVPNTRSTPRNCLRLFDLDSVDSSIIEDGINFFDKTDIARNPDPSVPDEQLSRELLRIFPTILMVKWCFTDHRRSYRKRKHHDLKTMLLHKCGTQKRTKTRCASSCR